MNISQSLGTYLFYEKPKQLFVGAELCARWYQLLSGDVGSSGAEAVISYAQTAQEAFVWPDLGKALFELPGRVEALRKEPYEKIVIALSESISLSITCGEVVTKISLKKIGFMVDMVGGLVGVKESLSDSSTAMKVESIATVCLILTSIGIYYVDAPVIILSRVSLILNTTMFVANYVDFHQTFNSKKDLDGTK
jgi:hypothetical protein